MNDLASILENDDIDGLKKIFTSEMDMGSMLREASSHGSTRVVKFLLRKGALNLIPENDEEHPFLDACCEGFMITAKLFIKAGVKVDMQDNEESEIVNLLLWKGASTEIPDSDGNTPFLLACEHGEYEIMVTLASVGANANHKNNEGKGASDLICHDDTNSRKALKVILSGTIEKVPRKMFVTRGDKQPSKWDANKNLDMMRFIYLKCPGYKVGTDEVRDTCENGDPLVLDSFIDVVQCVDFKTPEGLTPMHVAIKRGNTEVIRILVRAGHSVTLPNTSH